MKGSEFTTGYMHGYKYLLTNSGSQLHFSVFKMLQRHKSNSDIKATRESEFSRNSNGTTCLVNEERNPTIELKNTPNGHYYIEVTPNAFRE